MGGGKERLIKPLKEKERKEGAEKSSLERTRETDLKVDFAENKSLLYSFYWGYGGRRLRPLRGAPNFAIRGDSKLAKVAPSKLSFSRPEQRESFFLFLLS